MLTPGRIAGVAVIHDSVASTLSASLRVCGAGQFSLCSAAEQDGRVAGWGDALAAFCRERRTVCRVAWQEWTTSSVLPATELAPVDGGAPGADYRTLIERAAPRATVHETLVTITVDLRAVTARRGKSADTTAAGLQLLLDELRLFSQRLEAAGLGVDSPLSPAELAVVVRRRSNPFAEHETTTLSRSLASGFGVTTMAAAPMAYGEAWDHARIDGAVHRSWWIEGWPRLEVPAAWLDLVLLAGTATRTVTIVFHPISPSQAARAIDAAAVALESAESAKIKHGFRVRAKDRRARDEIDQREHELVAGHGDLEYVGFVDIAVPSTDGLDDASGELEQTVGHVGLQLRRLDGRHGLGWVTGLPLGR